MITRRGFILGTLSAGMAAALAKVLPKKYVASEAIWDNVAPLKPFPEAYVGKWETAFDPASPDGDYGCSVTWFDAERRVIGRVDHLKPNTTYYPQFNLKSGDLEMIEANRSEQSTNKNLLTSKRS